MHRHIFRIRLPLFSAGILARGRSDARNATSVAEHSGTGLPAALDLITATLANLIIASQLT
jgi:hypothetical protein